MSPTSGMEIVLLILSLSLQRAFTVSENLMQGYIFAESDFKRLTTKAQRRKEKEISRARLVPAPTG
jgi:hypothetical protein